jgi:ribosomal protein L7/L12
MGMSELTVALIVIAVVVFIALKVFEWRLPRFPRETQLNPALIEWDALNDDRVQQHLPHNKIGAIKAYREITDVGLKEAKDAIEYYLAHRDEAQHHGGKKQRSETESLSDAGVRDLLNEGKFEDAVNAYKTFAGVDYFTARNAVEDIQRRMPWMQSPKKEGEEKRVRVIFDRDVQGLVSEGKLDAAIDTYKIVTGVDEAEARQAVEQIARDMYGRSIPPDTSDVPEDDVRDLLSKGRKIEAVQRVRAVTKLGLKEAKDAVDEIERTMQAENPPPAPVVLEDEVRDLLRQGKKIEAIKRYREATNLGLKEAKDAVDEIERKLNLS